MNVRNHRPVDIVSTAAVFGARPDICPVMDDIVSRKRNTDVPEESQHYRRRMNTPLECPYRNT